MACKTKPDIKTMSRETVFKEGAWIGSYEYSNERTLKEDIAKKENDVLWYKEKLLALAMATPKDITPDGSDPLEHVKLTFDELWDELQDELFRLSDMYLIEINKENIDDGSAPQCVALRDTTNTGNDGED